MRQYFFSWMLLLALVIGVSEVKAQNLIIKLKDGSENTQSIESVQKFSFTNGDLLLKYLDGSTDAFSLSTISSIRFKQSPTGIDNPTVAGFEELSVFPNPAKDFITLRNIPSGSSTVAIFQMDGTMVLQTRVSSDVGTIDIRNLGKGLYLIKINGKSFKFIKL